MIISKSLPVVKYEDNSVTHNTCPCQHYKQYPVSHRPTCRLCHIIIIMHVYDVSLFQGATPAVLGQTSKTAVVFMCYGLCEEAVRRLACLSNVEDLHVWHHAMAGTYTMQHG